MRRLLAAALLALVLPGATGAAAPRTQFSVVGGSVTIRVAPQTAGALAADGASLRATAPASAAVGKDGVTTLRFAAAARPGGGVELARHCRCVSFSLRGGLVLSGNGAQTVFAGPAVFLDGVRGQHRIVALTGGFEASAFALAGITLPRSLAGRTLKLTGVQVWLRPAAAQNQRFAAVAPRFPQDRDVLFGTLTATLRLK